MRGVHQITSNKRKTKQDLRKLSKYQKFRRKK